jgi:hypothetical protein
MFKKIFNYLPIWLILLTAKKTSAQQLINANTTKYNSGNYQLNDLVLTAINGSVIILGLVGSLALLFFIYGGLMLLLSAGNTEKLTKAKGILKATVIGLIIVFTSYIIIRFALQAIGVDWKGGLIT